MARNGADILSTYVEMFISSQLPKLPAIGVGSVRDYLLSDEMLANVSKHIGTKDLILSAVSFVLVSVHDIRKAYGTNRSMHFASTE